MAQLVDLDQATTTRRSQQDDSKQDVLFDSGANCCITPHKGDFKGHLEAVQDNTIIDGIGKGLHIKGKGHVTWTFKADNGMYRTLKLPGYYVLGANMRIASVQEVLRAYPGEEVPMR